MPPCLEVGIDYPGNDKRTKLYVTSWKECSNLCRETPTCEVWTWKSVGIRDCYAKSGISRKSSNANAVSGSRTCGESCKITHILIYLIILNLC